MTAVLILFACDVSCGFADPEICLCRVEELEELVDPIPPPHISG